MVEVFFLANFEYQNIIISISEFKLKHAFQVIGENVIFGVSQKKKRIFYISYMMNYVEGGNYPGKTFFVGHVFT